MAESTVDIDQVPPDIDPMATGVILNPLSEEFVFGFAGKEYTIPAASEESVEGEDGKKKKTLVAGRREFPLTACVHFAKHLAEKIIRDEHRKGVLAIKDDKRRDDESRKAIPDYKGKIFEKMKTLVITDSDFFGKESTKESFIR